MSKEHSPIRHRRSGVQSDDGEPGDDDSDLSSSGYWYELINERTAAAFLDVTDRSMQKWRQTGDGPKFVRLSARCVKYRRIECRVYSEARLRASTSDIGPEASAA